MLKQLRIRFVAASMAGMLLVTILVVGAINVINYVNEKKTIDEMLMFIKDNGGKLPVWGVNREEGGIPALPDGENNALPDGKMPELPEGEQPDLTEGEKSEGVENKNYNNSNNGNSKNGEGDWKWKNKDDAGKRFERLDLSDETSYITRYFVAEYNSAGNVINTNLSNIASFTEDEAKQIAQKLYSEKDKQGRDGKYYYSIYEGEKGRVLIYLDCTREVKQGRQLLLISLLVAFGSLVFEAIVLTLLSKRVVKPVVESVEKQKAFITDASHELKTPLTIISANTEVLEMVEGENEWTESIKKQTGRLSKLVNEMVYLAKMDEERPVMQPEDFSLSAAVSETVMPFETVAAGKGFTFETNMEEDLNFFGDEAAVRQLVSIFMDNAMKYTGKNEKGDCGIKVSLVRKGKKAKLRFFNTCEKISKEELDKLFERFYRVDKSRSSETGGSGIGLSIVKAIADNHKGINLSVKSPEEGTIEFLVEFKLG